MIPSEFLAALGQILKHFVLTNLKTLEIKYTVFQSFSSPFKWTSLTVGYTRQRLGLVSPFLNKLCKSLR